MSKKVLDGQLQIASLKFNNSESEEIEVELTGKVKQKNIDEVKELLDKNVRLIASVEEEPKENPKVFDQKLLTLEGEFTVKVLLDELAKLTHKVMILEEHNETLTEFVCNKLNKFWKIKQNKGLQYTYPHKFYEDYTPYFGLYPYSNIIDTKSIKTDYLQKVGKLQDEYNYWKEVVEKNEGSEK